ncbi:MAG: hypothetical protein KQJ78_06655 [Deltaproteobacteria bacterium]|nr:hypothetical protein [Deltaproteobacteria bacterium]
MFNALHRICRRPSRPGLAITALALALALAWGLAPATPAQAQAGDDWDIFRNELRDQLKQTQALSAVLSGLLTMAISPDWSAAFYTLGEDSESQSAVDMNTIKIPLYKRFPLAGRAWEPFAGITLGYMEVVSQGEYAVDPSAPVDGVLSYEERWRCYSAFGETGVKLPLGWGFSLIPSVGGGWAQVRNLTDYRNEFSREFIARLFDGLLTNFSLDAVVFMAALRADYERKLGPLNLRVKLKGTEFYLDVVDATDEAQEFSGNNGTLTGRVELTGPTGLDLGSYPLLWQGFVGGFQFLGPDAEALGFDHFVEIGAYLGVDLRRAGLWVDALKLGGSLIAGDDITGWSVSLGYSF